MTYRFPAVLCSRVSFRLSVRLVVSRVILRGSTLYCFSHCPIRAYAVYMQFILQVTKGPRENRRVMDIDYDIILEQSRRLYGALPLRDTRTGHLESFQSIRSRMQTTSAIFHPSSHWLTTGWRPETLQKMESILLSIAFYFPDFALRRASALERAACV